MNRGLGRRLALPRNAPPVMHRRSALGLDFAAAPCSGGAANCSGAAMRAITLTLSAAAAMALSACATRPEAPAAPAPVLLAPTPPPAPLPPPPEDWRDIALTPGDWTYRAETAGPVARYGAGAPAFALRCNQA